MVSRPRHGSSRRGVVLSAAEMRVVLCVWCVSGAQLKRSAEGSSNVSFHSSRRTEGGAAVNVERGGLHRDRSRGRAGPQVEVCLRL
jgi:hypothetical protein